MPDRLARRTGSLLLVLGLTGCTSSAAPPESAAPSTSNARSAEAFLVRRIAPTEYTPVVGGCVLREGIPVDLSGDDINAEQVPAGLQTALQEALSLCSLRYPVQDPNLDTPSPAATALDDEQLDRLHDYIVGQAVPCLENQGLTGFLPPSRDVFVRTWGTPYSYLPTTDPGVPELAELSAQQWEELQLTCRPVPDASALQ